eukprot:m.137560 g.137560  ORF g.137560 m.137560 type:complete len:616 (-) comp23997_c0_seq8:64-1911(-)
MKFLPLLLLVVGTNAATYWWKFQQSDCPYDDVHKGNATKAENCCTKPSCTIEECQAMCLSIPECGGFNFPHGVLKKVDCLSHKVSSSVDLYLKEDSPQPPTPSNFPPVWPHPKQFSNGTQNVTLMYPFHFDFPANSTTLSAAVERYTLLFFPRRTPSTTPQTSDITQLTIQVADLSEAYPQLDTDESYTLDIPTSGTAVLKAGTVYGALRGLETMSQLIRYNFDNGNYQIAHAPWSIQDEPALNFRGVMVDTSRHFIPIPVLHSIIDGMAYSKLNVMHWHHEDSQSFPMVFNSRPEFSKKGAYSPASRYSIEDVEDLVEYSRLRGVRVLMEFDVPGHAGSWCAGYPEICPSSSCLEPLNVASNATFEAIDDLLTEITNGGTNGARAPFEFLHMGGDEVNYKCWQDTPAIADWVKENCNNSMVEAYGYFVERAQNLARKNNRQFINWVEVFERLGTNLDKDTVVHVWKQRDTLLSVLNAGYRAILSDAEQWYLTGPHVALNWTVYYNNNPFYNLTDAQRKLVIGGETCNWSETTDSANIEAEIFPRAAAAGERMWSPENINSTYAAAPRMAAFRCLLNRRGVRAAALNAPNNARLSSPPAYDNVISPYGPGACEAQ